MLLSEKDISRLEKQGFNRGSFVRYDRDGYAFLRNRQGHCVFYDSEQRCCSVYAMRPSGCRVYPVIIDEENGVIVDSICCSQETIDESEKKRRGKTVIKLLERIEMETQKRRSRQV